MCIENHITQAILSKLNSISQSNCLRQHAFNFVLKQFSSCHRICNVVRTTASYICVGGGGSLGPLQTQTRSVTPFTDKDTIRCATTEQCKFIPRNTFTLHTIHKDSLYSLLVFLRSAHIFTTLKIHSMTEKSTSFAPVVFSRIDTEWKTPLVLCRALLLHASMNNSSAMSLSLSHSVDVVYFRSMQSMLCVLYIYIFC